MTISKYLRENENYQQDFTPDVIPESSDEETPYVPGPDAHIIPDLYLPPGLVDNKPIDWELHVS